MKTIIRNVLAVAAAVTLAASCITATAQKKDPDVGGAPMYPNKTIVQNAVNSPVHKTLVAAVKAAGLVDTLNSPGPFTVFAPTDDAFAKLPAGTVDNLVKPENKEMLTKILTYHVVPGTYGTGKLMHEIKSHGGTLKLKTVEGGDLTFTMDGGQIKIADDKGGSAMITTSNVYQSNGVIQVIDTVLMP
ncbi:MAG TPA: fasciclin domain-containing protein [Acidobacteriaceae bacterium]